jgi:hypothetical protein
MYRLYRLGISDLERASLTIHHLVNIYFYPLKDTHTDRIDLPILRKTATSVTKIKILGYEIRSQTLRELTDDTTNNNKKTYY